MSDNRPLIEALNVIAGNQQAVGAAGAGGGVAGCGATCADNLMSHQDVARAALALNPTTLLYLSDLRTILARRVSEAGGPEAWGAQLGVQPHHVTAVLDHGAAPAPLLVAGLGLVEVRMYAVQGTTV